MKTPQGTGVSGHAEQSCSLMRIVTLLPTLCSVGSLQKDHFFRSKESYLSGTLVPEVVNLLRYSDKLNCSLWMYRDTSILNTLAGREITEQSCLDASSIEGITGHFTLCCCLLVRRVRSQQSNPAINGTEVFHKVYVTEMYSLTLSKMFKRYVNVSNSIDSILKSISLTEVVITYTTILNILLVSSKYW